jgi:hypothetical protein
LDDASNCLKKVYQIREIDSEIAKEKLIINMLEFYKILSWNNTPTKKELEYQATSYQNDLKNVQEHIYDKDFITEYNEILLKFIS